MLIINRYFNVCYVAALDRKKSVTDSRSQVKRKSLSWERKLTAEGKALLELRRHIAELQALAGIFPDGGFEPSKLDKVYEVSQRRWAMEEEHYRRFPKMKVVDLQPEFVALFPMLTKLKAGSNRLSQGMAESMEAAQGLAMEFEKQPQLRGVAYLFLSAVFGRAPDFLKMAARRMPFAPDQNRPDNAVQWFGKCLEMAGRMLQGEPLPKGKIDFELIDLIKLIREHETSRLTWSEVSDALAFAGRSRMDAENLRVFVHRVRKQGLL
jgi:hypothetical protein